MPRVVALVLGGGGCNATNPMSSVRVAVPGTTANVGPGFDCLGIALNVCNVVTVTKAEELMHDGMVDQAAKAFFWKAHLAEFPYDWEIEGEVPRSRGMGSSVTVRLGILHGLNELAGRPLSAEALYLLCAELEGHPDNAAPAAFGGFTIARKDGSFQRYAVAEELKFVLLVPDFEVATPDARRVLPAMVSLEDAVISVGNAAAIAGAFASGNYAKLADCFEDRLHQPYREPLVPCLSDVLKAGCEAGALGGWLSGSGSTMACLTLENAEAVAQAMREASGLSTARTIITTADNQGVRITSEG